MDNLKNDEICQAVSQQHGRVADSGMAGCGASSSCCHEPASDVTRMSHALGCNAQDIEIVPTGAHMGLGGGNPRAIAALRAGEVVLDLGSGGGFDCFLAARAVGDTGPVIGIDMTVEIIIKARTNAVEGGYHNVEFRLGEIENLPLADKSVDVIISNGVINLSPDKSRVFVEAFRVLKPGGRLAISDIVASAQLPEDVKNDTLLNSGCMAGASSVSEIESMLKASGFVAVRVEPKDEGKSFIRDWTPGTDITAYVVSAHIEGVKPGIEW